MKPAVIVEPNHSPDLVGTKTSRLHLVQSPPESFDFSILFRPSRFNTPESLSGLSENILKRLPNKLTSIMAAKNPRSWMMRESIYQHLSDSINASIYENLLMNDEASAAVN
jgi:hypothetical protein